MATVRPNAYYARLRQKVHPMPSKSPTPPSDPYTPSQPQRPKKRSRSPSPDDVVPEGMTHTMLQLRPCASLLSSNEGRPSLANKRMCISTRRRASLSRWVFIYFPLVLFVLYLLYTIGNVLIKRLAFNMLFEGVELPPVPPPALPSMDLEPIVTNGNIAPSQQHQQTTRAKPSASSRDNVSVFIRGLEIGP